ncbi:unnamed protein product [Hapterophycus canaliculatus]
MLNSQRRTNVPFTRLAGLHKHPQGRISVSLLLIFARQAVREKGFYSRVEAVASPVSRSGALTRDSDSVASVIVLHFISVSTVRSFLPRAPVFNGVAVLPERKQASSFNNELGTEAGEEDITRG